MFGRINRCHPSCEVVCIIGGRFSGDLMLMKGGGAAACKTIMNLLWVCRDHARDQCVLKSTENSSSIAILLQDHEVCILLDKHRGSAYPNSPRATRTAARDIDKANFLQDKLLLATVTNPDVGHVRATPYVRGTDHDRSAPSTGPDVAIRRGCQTWKLPRHSNYATEIRRLN